MFSLSFDPTCYLKYASCLNINYLNNEYFLQSSVLFQLANITALLRT